MPTHIARSLDICTRLPDRSSNVGHVDARANLLLVLDPRAAVSSPLAKGTYSSCSMPFWMFSGRSAKRVLPIPEFWDCACCGLANSDDCCC